MTPAASAKRAQTPHRSESAKDKGSDSISITQARAEVQRAILPVRKALAFAFSGSAEHGSFLRGGGGEYCPSVFMLMNQLEDACDHLLLVVGQPRDHVVDTATMMTDTSSPSENARPRIILAGWHGLKGDPESHEGGSAEGYLSAAREAIAILEQRIREQFTPALNTGSAMDGLRVVASVITEMRQELAGEHICSAAGEPGQLSQSEDGGGK